MPQQAPARGKLRDFSFERHLGVSRLSDRLTTNPDFFYGIKNGYVSKQNYIEQRNGFAVLTTAALTGTPKIRKVFEFENSTGGRTVIVRGGTRWARLNGTTFTDLDTGRGSDAHGQCCQFNNILIMCDGGAARQSTAAWSVSAVGASGPTLSSACHTHNSRLILNDLNDYTKVYVSKVGSIDFDTATDNAIVLQLSKVIPGGDQVLGFSTFLNTFLVIWMRRHVVIYNLPTTYSGIALQQVLNVGCISYDGVYQVGADLYFPSESGYKSLSASLGTENTMDLNDVTKLIDPYYSSSLAAVSDKEDMVAVYYQKLNHFYFTMPFSSAPEVWAISKDLEAATGGKGNIAGYFTGITAHSFCERKSGALIFGSSDGHLYTMDSGTNDNGTAISFEIEKSGLYFGTVKMYKAPREFEALIKASANLTLYLDYTFGSAGLASGVSTDNLSITTQTSPWDTSSWDVSYWDAEGQSLLRTRNLRGRGKIMNLRLRHATLNAKVSIPYFIISLLFQGDK